MRLTSFAEEERLRPALRYWLSRPFAERVAAVEYDGIFVDIFVATTVHIPAALLKAVDRRARALGVSRNRLIVRALERAVTDRSAWPPEFLEQLRRVDRETEQAVDDLLADISRARRSKPPRDL